MSDYYNLITETDTAIVENLALVLETRGADAQQQRMLRAYLSEIRFPEQARVLEIGSGTGAVTRQLAEWPDVAEAHGLDPSPVFVARARELGRAHPALHFHEGSAHALPFADDSFDVVVFHTTLCHLTDPEHALRQARRVLRPAGWLAVFDGDYASTTLESGDHDPLQRCIEAFLGRFLIDRWIGRRTPRLAREAGFEPLSYRSHGYTEAARSSYLLSLVDRGADVLQADGCIGPALASALKAEARQRVDEHRFFGHISYTSLIARKPASA